MNGKKCLLISPVAENNFGGGIGLNKSRILLTELFRDNLYCVDFRMGVLSNVQKLRWTLQGYTVGLIRENGSFGRNGTRSPRLRFYK